MNMSRILEQCCIRYGMQLALDLFGRVSTCCRTLYWSWFVALLLGSDPLEHVLC